MRKRAEAIHLDLSSHPFLGDHRLSGRPVLPLASALEMLAEFAAAEPPFALHDVRVERGLILFSEAADVDVHRDGDRLILREVRPSGRVVPAFSACLGTPTDTVPQSVAPPVESSVLTAPVPQVLDLDTFYREHAFHGKRMRAVQHLDARDETRIAGQVRTSRPTDWQPLDRRPRWRLDPLVIDGAFQLALYQSIVIAGRRMVPTRVDEVGWLRDPLEPTVTVTVTRTGDLTCDAEIVDRKGQIGFLRQARGRLI